MVTQGYYEMMAETGNGKGTDFFGGDMDDFLKIPFYLYREFEQDWFNDYRRGGNGTRNSNDLRFGQAFLNHFYPTAVDPDLFYQENIGACIALILQKYVLL